MKMFLTWESTFDVPRITTDIIVLFNDEFNNLINERDFNGYYKVSLLAIVFILMNPAVAPPFPEGFIFRRSNKAIDWKKRIDFNVWMNLDNVSRINLIHHCVKELICVRSKKYLPDFQINILSHACDIALTNVVLFQKK